MKPFVQKLPLTEETSFVARTYCTPAFEVSWHQHVEYELILFTKGRGMGFIGNYIGEFETGDIFFLGSNLPHTFQKRDKEMINSAVVIQFREDFWGKDFMALPESQEIQQLFQMSGQGLKIKGQSKFLLQPLIRELEYASGFSRITGLCNCLQIIAREQEFTPLSTQDVKVYNSKDKERIEKVFHYTIESFAEPVTLTEIAKLVNMSVPAFCNYFKKSTKKTYIDFLNEVRIRHACKLLTDTERTILNICFESGFNTLANFNKQFLKVKGITPSKYRNISKM